MTDAVDLDLDLLAAEADDKPKTVRLGGKVYELPALLPLAVGEYLTNGDLAGALRLLFGDQADEVLPLVNERNLKALTGPLYGVDAGE